MTQQLDIEEFAADGTYSSPATDATLLGNGWEIVACDGKAAFGPGWPTRANSIEAIAAERAIRPAAKNTGARTGRVSANDIDLVPPDHVAAMKRLADEKLGSTAMDRIGAKGLTDYRRNETPIGKITISGVHGTLTHVHKGKTVPLPGKVEQHGVGQQSVIYGVHPDTGKPWQWPNAFMMSEPLQTAVDDLIEVTPAMLREYARAAKTLMEELGYVGVTVSGDIETVAPEIPSSASGKRLSWAGLGKRLSWIHPRFDGGRPAAYPAPSRKRLARPLAYDGGAWLSLALCLRDGSVPLLDAQDHDWFDLIEQWSSGELWFQRTGERLDLSDRLPEQGIQHRLQGETRNDGITTTVASIIEYAADGGCPLPPDDEPHIDGFEDALANLNAEDAAAPTAPASSAVTQGEIDSSVPGSEDDIAIQYAMHRSQHLKHIPEIKKWVAFDGRQWVEHGTPVIWNDLLVLARSVAQHSASDSVRKKIVSKSTVANVEALLRGNSKHVVKLERWDSDPWLLNACGQMVDLRTGRQRDLEPTDYCMKSTAISPAPDGADPREVCPLWLQTIATITAGDEALASFIQRMMGYCLTGVTTEHAMFFWFGTGANGKGVVLNTVTRILGDYARIAPVDTFTASNNDRHPTDMAMLRGARLVAAQETDQGRQWAEAKIKALTGGDPITARFMHQDFFEYTPQFKLVIAGNHKPRLKNVDEAMRRRLHLVPFAVTIPEGERDPDLQDKLKAEWPGILRWAIEGCLAWQKPSGSQGRSHGLRPPPAVQAATVEYFSDQDTLESWLAERCIVGQGGWTSSTDLFGDYRAHFHRENGNDAPDGSKQFSQRMEGHGFKRSRQGKDGTRGFAGITIRSGQAALDQGEG